MESTHGEAEVKSRLAAGDQTARLENAFNIVTKAEVAEKKIRAAIKSGALAKKKGPASWEDAFAKKIISDVELRLLAEAEKVRYDAILVDDYTESAYQEKIK